MKKLKLFFALFAMLALGVGNAWAEDYSIKFLTAGSDGSTEITTSTKTSTVLESASCDYVTGFTNNCTKAYYKGKSGVKLSSSKAAGAIELTLSNTCNQNVSKVVFKTVKYNTESSTLTFYAGTSTLGTIAAGSDFSHTFTTPQSVSTLKIASSKRAYISEIIISISSGETPEPDPDPTPDPEDPETPGTGSSTNWVETVIADITASDIVAITMSKDGTTYALTSAKGSSAAPTAVVVTVNGDKLAAEPIDELKWNIATSGTGYIIYPNGINNKYLYCTNTNNGVRVGTGDAKVFTINSGYLYTTQTADARHIGVYNAQDWRCYKPSSGAIASNISGQTLKFYKYVAPSSGGGDEPEPEKTATSLEWSQTEYAVTMGEIPTFPTLTTTPADLTGVTYSSSNGAVATIAEDGTITIKAAGETTIKASYAGNETYAAATDATYKLTVNKAPANPTDNVYVKVTSDEGLTNGEYLVVYEDETAPVAFDGSLTTLDAAKNTVAVGISNSTIAGNTDIDAALFTIDVTAGTLKSASGKYIGVSSNTNGLKTEDVAKDYKNAFSVDDNGNAVIAADFEGSTMSLRYNNTAGDNNLRFRYYKNAGQQPIALYKKVDPSEILAPAFSVAAGSYYDAQSVEITCATAGADVYYTLDGTDPTSESTKYTGAISIASTTTVKTIAVKGANSSEVVSATYTILAPLATMQAIFDEATEIGKDAVQSVKITFDEWVISAVVPGKDEKPSSNAYITDGDKGFIIYTNTGHGFKVGDKLSGTITCDLTLYNGSAEVKGLISTTTGLTVVENGTITPVELNATQIEELSGVNTGSVIKITGPCTVDGTKYYVAGVQLYNSLYTYTNPEEGYNYECTGVYLQYNTTKEILPRKAEDLVKIVTQQPAGIKFETTEYTANVNEAFTAPTLTNPNGLTVAYSTSDATLATVNATTGEVTILNKTGKVTITASFAGNEDYVAATASYNVTISDPSISEATFVAGTDKSEELSISKDGVTVEFTGGTFSRDDNYRCYANQSMTISYNDGQITKIVLAKSSDNSKTPSNFTTEQGTYAYAGSEGVWIGEAKSVTFETNTQVQMNTIAVYYKQDTRTAAGLEWSSETINLTVGDAFTAPTLNNPNSVSDITYESSNEDVATVSDAGVIDLVDDAVGTATITASFAGDATYKPATATCVVIVNEYVEIVSGVWQLVTDAAALKAGDKVIVASAEAVDGKYYALSTTQNKNNRGQADVNKIEENVTFSTDVQVLTLEVGVEENTFAFNTGSGYLYAASSSANHLKTQEDLDANGSWTISIDANTGVATVKAQGGNTHNLMQYNKSSKLFSSYDKPQQGIALYKKMPDYTREVDPQYYGTICLPKAGKFVGGSLYEVAYYDETTKKVYFDEVLNGEMEAGMPYIFLANATMIEAYYTNDEEATAKKKNGLYGTLVDITSGMNADGVYMIYRNQIIHSIHKDSYLKANRAYIKLTEVPGYNDPSYVAPAPAPGRKRIAMGTTGQNTATGVDQVQGDNVPTKMIINGQLFILRGEKMYDAQGKLVK